MQQEFYIGQKVRTSQIGIEKGCSDMEGVISAYTSWYSSPALDVTLSNGNVGLFLPEEIEPIEDSVSKIVFDNIVNNL